MKTIVNADDFGYSSSVNQAISEAFKQKYISQTTILVNMPGIEEGICVAREENFIDKVGLHLNLTEGFPLTERMKQNKHFVHSDGTFNGSLIDIAKYRFIISRKDKLCIKDEVDAQMKKYINSGFSLMHIDSHHHIHNSISLVFIIIKLARKNGFKSMRICRNIVGKNKSFLKMLYKIAINFFIAGSFKTVHSFGEYYYYEKYYSGNGDVEVMVHPDLIKGEIVDILKKNTWKKMSSYKYCNLSTLTTY
jgi:chitin disaccharide deacetylase